MILVIGGMGAGKKDYVLSLGYAPQEIATDIKDERPVLYGLERLVFAAPEQAMELLPALRRKEVVICCEVGSGVIPATRQIREGREATGRLCIALAKEAEKVVRLVSGVPLLIKGE